MAPQPMRLAQRQMRFTIANLGCRLSHAESSSIATRLIDAGWELVPQSGAGGDSQTSSIAKTDKAKAPEAVDVAIVNTCTVTTEADAKSRKKIRKLAKDAGHVLVCGCAAAIDPKRIAALGDNVICITDIDRVAEVACELVGGAAGGAADGAADGAAGASEKGHLSEDGQNASTEAAATGTAATGAAPADATRKSTSSPETTPTNECAPKKPQRTRVDVKIQDGCDNACTFCIVHVARGPARSVPADEVVSRVAGLAASGTREVVLSGIDLGAYQCEGLDLNNLLGRLIDETSIERIRLSSVEPHNIDVALMDRVAAAQGRICRHLHLCLQSGSDKVLTEMGRRYSASEFLELAGALRQRMPNIALSGDVIVGFPGEDDEDFSDTMDVVRQCRFMRLHVFRYSKRPGTPAAERADQVAPKIAAMRADRLRELAKRMAAEDRERRVGTVEQVIVEGDSRGTSESYHRVIIDGPAAPGSLIPMCLIDIDEDAHALVARPL